MSGDSNDTTIDFRFQVIRSGYFPTRCPPSKSSSRHHSICPPPGASRRSISAGRDAKRRGAPEARSSGGEAGGAAGAAVGLGGQRMGEVFVELKGVQSVRRLKASRG